MSNYQDMKKSRLLISKAVYLLPLLLLLASGCAVPRPPAPMNAQDIRALKARLGQIGIARASYLPHVEVQVPSKGRANGAKDGAKVGAIMPIEFALEAVQGCGDPSCAYILLGGFALAPVGAVIGGVGGAITADPAKAVSQREARIDEVLAKLRMQQKMDAQFVSRLSSLKTFTFTELAKAGPVTEAARPDYRRYRASGIDTVNEIDVKKLTLTGWGKVQPDLSLSLDVQVRLVATADNKALYCREYVCTSTDDKFAAWAAQDARKFRKEIGACYHDIADWSVHDLYVNDTIIRPVPEPVASNGVISRRSTVKCSDAAKDVAVSRPNQHPRKIWKGQ